MHHTMAKKREKKKPQKLTNDIEDCAYCGAEEEERYSKACQSCLELASSVSVLANDHALWRHLGDEVCTAYHHANTEHQHHIGDPKYPVSGQK